MTTSSKFLRFFAPDWGSVARIGCWCLLFLWSFGHFVPQLPEEIPLAKAEAGTGVTPMLTIFDDHRTMREDVAPDPKKLHIVWISDSSGAVIPPDKKWSNMDSEEYHTIPEFVVASLERKHKLDNVNISLYLRLGTRSVDNLVFALLAAQQKPDLIVLPVNIVWTFSHYQVMNKATSMNIAPSVWAKYPKLWYMIPMFCSPVQDLWAIAGNRFDIIRYASPFRNELERRYAAWLEALGGSGPTPISLGVPIFNMQFWVIMNMLRGNEATLLEDGKPDVRKYYTKLIGNNSPYHDGSLATNAFTDMLEALKDSGIPVLIYEHPVSDYFYAMPDTVQKIEETQDFLDKTDAGLKGSGIHLIGAIPEAVRKSIPFRKKDDYHADRAPAQFDDFLADQIWLMLRNNTKIKKDAQ